jgi:SulP family sulfate permease
MKTVYKPARMRLDRMEIAGSLGDLGTLLPLVLGMILLNGVDATASLMMVGLFYLVAGLYFRVPVSVQPMKAIAAYAIATGLTPLQISTAGAWMAALLLLFGATNLISLIRRAVPLPAIRGVQLGLGAVLMIRGFELMVQPDGGLAIESVGPVGTGLILGGAGLAIGFLLLDNRKLPAALVIVGLGVFAGLAIGEPVEWSSLRPGLHLPQLLPHGWPAWRDVWWVLPVVVLPQLPMTVGNAVLANTDLTWEYFPRRAGRMTNRASAISQGLANVVSFFLGGVPMCHGAGGLAAHYRFGARTSGSNLFIGALLAAAALVLGDGIVTVLGVVPASVLGVLLVFAGLQLALMIQDLRQRGDLFVVLSMLGLTLVFNLAVAFVIGLGVAWILKTGKVKV